MNILEWWLIGVWCVLISAGVLYVVKPQKVSRDALFTRRIGWLLIPMGSGALCDMLPRRLGAGYDVRLTFSTLAVVVGTPAVLLAIYNLHAYSRSKRGRTDTKIN
jgi:hypothetical protein